MCGLKFTLESYPTFLFVVQFGVLELWIQQRDSTYSGSSTIVIKKQRENKLQTL